MSGCHCSYCVGGREKKYDLNSIADFDDEPRYRKVSKRVKYCKKSKTKEKCEPTDRKVKWSYTKRNEDGTPYEDGYYSLACHRCGKEFGFYRFTAGKRY